MNQNTNEERFLNVKEVATKLHLSRSAVYNLITRGLLTGINLACGRRMVPRIRSADIEEFIQHRVMRGRPQS